MKTRITAILLICVVLSISAQAATGGKITSVADPDRFTKSEIVRSDREFKKSLDDFTYSFELIQTITPARANAFFCDHKELIAACGDFLKTESGGISVSYNGAKETDKYSYWDVKVAVDKNYGSNDYFPIAPPEGHEVIEQLCAKLLEEHMIEEDIYFVVGYYPESDLGYFDISFSVSLESNDSLIIRNMPKSDVWKAENKDLHVYRDFYICYMYIKGDVVWGRMG